ncbi:MAG: hypothetical protein LBH96_06540 [Candidatus Peribacteria bacterium]|jgi:hypothetical protein|nr:hypothetical protein [Candidatus Peribacteria bacterium]
MNEQEAHRDFMITTVSLNKSNEDIEKLKHYVIGEVGDTLILGYKEHIEDKDACLIGEIDKEDFSTLLCSYLDLVCKDNFDEKCPRNSDQEKMFSKYRRE